MAIRLVALTSLNPGMQDKLDEYMNVVGKLMSAADAEIVERYELQADIVGDGEFQFVTIVDYPDQAAVDSVFKSAEYLALSDVKESAFSCYQIYTIAKQA
ncbi:MAG: DUF1330 domain-containing protein [Cyanobacteria bacterium J06627_8]